MDHDENIKQLVEKLEQELEKHNLTFDEYLLYKAIHTYENKDESIAAKLEEKGFIKDAKIVDPSFLSTVENSIFDGASKHKHDTEDDLLHVLSFLWFYNSGHGTIL